MQLSVALTAFNVSWLPSLYGFATRCRAPPSLPFVFPLLLHISRCAAAKEDAAREKKRKAIEEFRLRGEEEKRLREEQKLQQVFGEPWEMPITMPMHHHAGGACGTFATIWPDRWLEVSFY